MEDDAGEDDAKRLTSLGHVLRAKYGIKMNIEGTSQSGRIILEYSSSEQLNLLIGLLTA